MDWKEQQQSGQYPGPPNVPPAPAAPGVPAYYSNSPLQGPMARPEQQMSNDAFLPGANPIVPGQQPVPSLAASSPMQPPAVGMPALARPATATTDDNAASIDDVEWVNRAKRSIASSQGDPHRQVQLMQHLRSQYLQQRYGRTVHTDEA